MRPSARFQHGSLGGRGCRAAGARLLLGHTPLQAPPMGVSINGSPLPLADIAVQDVLDVLHDEVNRHWRREREKKRNFV